MNTRIRMFSLLALSLLLTGCSGIFEFVRNGRTVRASDTVVSETREVSGFTAVEMRGIGKVILTQGETESLAVRGSDNVVPLVRSSVRGGVLVLELEPNVNVTGMDAANVLTFTVGVKDLAAVTVSGLGDVEMNGLTASRLTLTMSGAGKVAFTGLAVEDLHIGVNGMGDVTLSGEAATAAIDISGAGNVKAADCKIQTARITISGAGNATLWVTEKLTGDISGAGNVEYYGNPQAETDASGLGVFKSLGGK